MSNYLKGFGGSGLKLKVPQIQQYSEGDMQICMLGSNIQNHHENTVQFWNRNVQNEIS